MKHRERNEIDIERISERDNGMEKRENEGVEIKMKSERP